MAGVVRPPLGDGCPACLVTRECGPWAPGRPQGSARANANALEEPRALTGWCSPAPTPADGGRRRCRGRRPGHLAAGEVGEYLQYVFLEDDAPPADARWRLGACPRTAGSLCSAKGHRSRRPRPRTPGSCTSIQSPAVAPRRTPRPSAPACSPTSPRSPPPARSCGCSGGPAGVRAGLPPRPLGAVTAAAPAGPQRRRVRGHDGLPLRMSRRGGRPGPHRQATRPGDVATASTRVAAVLPQAPTSPARLAPCRRAGRAPARTEAQARRVKSQMIPSWRAQSTT
jgi:hypothetical protein